MNWKGNIQAVDKVVVEILLHCFNVSIKMTKKCYNLISIFQFIVVNWNSLVDLEVHSWVRGKCK